MSSKIKTGSIKAWALVDQEYGSVVEFHATRELAREGKRGLSEWGIPTKIAKLSFSNFVR